MPCIPLIDDIFTIYEELRLNAKRYQQNKNQDKTPNRKQTQILNKWDEKWNRQLWKGRGDAHLKKCPMSSATRKIQIKTDLMLHLIPPITANVKNDAKHW